MQGADYIFCFQDKNYRFWQPDSTGRIVCSAQPYFIDFAPVEWEGIEITDVLNEKYWGADRSVTSNFTNVKDAAQILKHIFYTLGNEEEVYFTILSQELEYIPGVSYCYWYRQIFKGEVDLSEFNHDGPKVNIRCLEEGLVKYLKSNENTVFEYPMNVPEAITVKMDGIPLSEQLNYQDVDGIDVSLSAYGVSYIGGCSYINKDGANTGVAYTTESLESVAGQPFSTVVANSNVIIENAGSTSITFTLKGVLEFRCTGMVSSPAYAAKFRFLTSDQLIINQDAYLILTTAAMVVGQTYTQPFEIIITLPAGQKLLRNGQFFGGVGSEAIIQFTENSKFSILFKTRHVTTYIKAFTGQYLFEKLISSVTDNNFTAGISAFLNTYKQKVYTCGDAMRGLPDAVMKISWADFYKDQDSFHSVGIMETGTVVDLDTKQNLVDKVNIIQLPSPAYGSFKTSMAKKYLFNELEIGYPEIKNEIGVLNGKEAFCCKYLFSSGTTKSPAKLDKVSKIIADCYSQEYVRISTFEKSSTDNKADNDLFSLYIETALQPASGDIPAHYQLDRSLNALITAGLIEPDNVYNLELSPKRNMIRNGAWLRSCGFKRWDSKKLEYRSADKNNKVICDGIEEKADVPVSSLSSRFFEPVILTGDFAAPYDLLSQLSSNRKQIYSFELDGHTYYGIRLKVSTAPSNRKLQNMQFLSDSLNNLTNLINYNG